MLSRSIKRELPEDSPSRKKSRPKAHLPRKGKKTQDAADKEKTKNFYQSSGLRLPLEGKRFIGLFGSSIKTEEDLVKFKLQKEEEYKAAAAHEAVNEKDSSLQTQPADESHLQLRGTASYEPMVADSICCGQAFL